MALTPEMVTTLAAFAPTFLAVLAAIWQLNKVEARLEKHIEDTRDLLRAEVREVRSALGADISQSRSELRLDIERLGNRRLI